MKEHLPCQYDEGLVPAPVEHFETEIQMKKNHGQSKATAGQVVCKETCEVLAFQADFVERLPEDHILWEHHENVLVKIH